jgi:hypothetical protein
MTIALSIFLKELNVSAGTPKTADNTRGGSLLRDSEGTLRREHDVADVLGEALVAAVAVDDDPRRDAAGDQVDLPRAGMPARLADASDLQRQQQDAGLLAFEDREIVFVRLLKRAPVKRGGGLSAEMEQVRAASSVIGSSSSV